MLKTLQVYDFEDKIRLGINQDGGYVLANLGNSYDCYISCGISHEESFSRDFIEKYNMNKDNSYGFDGTIHDYPYHYTNKITFIKKNINGFNDDKNTNLLFLTELYNDIFLKIDIEGGEYPWLLSLNENHLTKFKQIVIEFHGINDNSWGCNYNDKLKCLEKLSNTHFLVHAHGNNNGKSKNGIPDVVELTYVNKKCFEQTPKFNSKSLPIKNLDFPNNPIYTEISLNNYPFVQ